MSSFTDNWDQPTSIFYLRFKWPQTLELKWLLLFLTNFNYFSFKIFEKKVIKFFCSYDSFERKYLICIQRHMWHFYKIELIKVLKTHFLWKFSKWKIRNKTLFLSFIFISSFLVKDFQKKAHVEQHRMIFSFEGTIMQIWKSPNML